MPATIRYNTFRLLMVIVIGAIAYVLGARGLVLIIIAFAVSLPLSFVLLARWRRAMIDEFASGKGQRLNLARVVNERIDAANDAEDEILDRSAEEPGQN